MAAEPLAQAAAARHRRAVERAEQALRDLDAEGVTISFQAVARRAGVSRQWLYTQPPLRGQPQGRARDPLRPTPPGARNLSVPQHLGGAYDHDMSDHEQLCRATGPTSAKGRHHGASRHASK